MDKFLDLFSLETGTLVPMVISIALSLLILAVGIRLINRFFRRARERTLASAHPELASVLPALRGVLIAILVFVFLTSILSQFPSLKKLMDTMLASSGIVALVVGFASQDAVANLTSGLLVTVFKPCKVGDTVRLVSQNITGVVEEISLRHTVIRTFDNRRTIIPNSTFNKEILENSNFSDSRICNYVEIGVTYESDLDLALEIMREEALAHPSHVDNRTDADRASGVPEITVRIIELADSCVKLRAWVWSADAGSGFAMKCDLLSSIKKRFDAAGIDIAYPHLVVMTADSEKTCR